MTPRAVLVIKEEFWIEYSIDGADLQSVEANTRPGPIPDPGEWEAATRAEGTARMLPLLSKGCQYAIRALLYAGGPDGSTRFLAGDVCREAGIPESFTRKVFRSLVEEGLLTAVRGPGGGYVLTESPARIPVLRVVAAVDGFETRGGECFLGLPGCAESRPCPLHERCARARSELVAGLRSLTVDDLARFWHGRNPDA